MASPAKMSQTDGDDDKITTVDGEKIQPNPPSDIEHYTGNIDFSEGQQDPPTYNVPTDPGFVDWDGPDDPANPRNWSRKRKMLNTALVSLSVLYLNIATTMYAPASLQLAADFGINDDSVIGTLSITITSLGASMGPLLFAPLSEAYGRVPVHWASAWLFICCTIGCSRSINVAMFLIFRFLSGACTASFMTCGGGTIADLLPKEERGTAMALFTAGPLLGPVIGPIIGGFVTQSLSWRWTLYLVLMLAGVVTIIAMVTMSETNAGTILSRKAARLRKETGNLQLHTAQSLQPSLRPREFVECIILRPVRVLLFSPIVMLMGVYMAFIFGLTFLLFATFPSIFEETYEWKVGFTGLAYLGLGIGCVIGLITLSLLSDKLIGRDGAPERRLILMMAFTFCIPGGMFWYGWAADRSAQWVVPIIGTVFIGMGILILSSSAQLYIMDMFGPQAAASSLAALTLVRNASGAFLPLAANPLYRRLGLGWGNSVLAFITLAFTPVPFVFYKYGGWLREKFPLKL